MSITARTRGFAGFFRGPGTERHRAESRASPPSAPTWCFWARTAARRARSSRQHRLRLRRGRSRVVGRVVSARPVSPGSPCGTWSRGPLIPAGSGVASVPDPLGCRPRRYHPVPDGRGRVSRHRSLLDGGWGPMKPVGVDAPSGIDTHGRHSERHTITRARHGREGVSKQGG
jgi:hypothetical protein